MARPPIEASLSTETAATNDIPLPRPVACSNESLAGRRPSLATGFAHEPRLEIREPNVIRPWICADRDRVAAMKVLAIDQDAAHAGVAHLSEGDLLRAARHGP
jgi:hypothetical protein